MWARGAWEELRWLRNNDPVHWDEKNQLFVISKYDDLVYISKNAQIFCSGEGTRPNMPTKLSIVDMDEPRHGQLQKAHQQRLLAAHGVEARSVLPRDDAQGGGSHRQGGSL